MPAVVVEGTLNGLGVVRSLAPGGMPVYLLETTGRCAARWSRRSRFVRVASLDGRVLIDALIDLGRRLGCRPVLILTGDQSVNSVSEHRRAIEPLYRISLPTHDMVRTLADKTLFQQLAEREGFAVPRGVCLGSATQLAELDSLSPPVVVKPADKTLVLDGTAERAVRAATVADARRAVTHMLARVPAVVVQEWVDGPDTEIFFTLFSCDAQGDVRGMFVGRKLVCSPPAVGSTAVCVSAPEVSEPLVASTLQFIARVGYRGLGSLEFKRERRTGRFLIIEPTVGRTDWQEELATLSGVNLPLISYRAELGLRLPADGTPPRAPVMWRQSLGFRAPQARAHTVIDGYWRWSDPLPALYHYGYERVLARLWNRARGAVNGLCAPARSDARR